jgi:hypothetical protein
LAPEEINDYLTNLQEPHGWFGVRLVIQGPDEGGSNPSGLVFDGIISQLKLMLQLTTNTNHEVNLMVRCIVPSCN